MEPVRLVLWHLVPLTLQVFPITFTLNLKVIAQAFLTQIVKLMHNQVAHRKASHKELQAHRLLVVGHIAKVEAMVGAHVETEN